MNNDLANLKNQLVDFITKYNIKYVGVDIESIEGLVDSPVRKEVTLTIEF